MWVSRLAGHGGGERGMLDVVGRDGRVVMVPSRGRGIDPDGDGLISRLEGLYAAPPKTIVSGRDGNRQTLVHRQHPVAQSARRGPFDSWIHGDPAIQLVLDRMSWVAQSANPVAFAPYLRESPLPGHPMKRVLVQFAKGDRLMANPVTSALIRSGQLTDVTTLYRADLAKTAAPGGMPNDPHNFLLDGVDAAERPFALRAQRQIATFLGSGGKKTVDPDGDGVIFETPIRGPLPEDLGFFP